MHVPTAHLASVAEDNQAHAKNVLVGTHHKSDLLADYDHINPCQHCVRSLGKGLDNLSFENTK